MKILNCALLRYAGNGKCSKCGAEGDIYSYIEYGNNPLSDAVRDRDIRYCGECLDTRVVELQLAAYNE